MKYRCENDLSNSPTLNHLLVLEQRTIPMYSLSISQSFFFINYCNHKIKFLRSNQNTHEIKQSQNKSSSTYATSNHLDNLPKINSVQFITLIVLVLTPLNVSKVLHKKLLSQYIEGILTIVFLMHQISTYRYQTKGKNLEDLL